MKDMDETSSEASWDRCDKRGRRKRCGVWSRRVKRRSGEAKSLGSKVKGVSVNPEGESRHRHARAKTEGEEIQSRKRKVIRVESEETQDYVTESLNLSRDEAEITFVPSALSIPRGATVWCAQCLLPKNFWIK